MKTITKSNPNNCSIETIKWKILKRFGSVQSFDYDEVRIKSTWVWLTCIKCLWFISSKPFFLLRNFCLIHWLCSHRVWACALWAKPTTNFSSGSNSFHSNVSLVFFLSVCWKLSRRVEMKLYIYVVYYCFKITPISPFGTFLPPSFAFAKYSNNFRKTLLKQCDL